MFIFKFSRVNVGLFCSTPAVAVGRSVPRKVAMEMLFTGQPITAQGLSWFTIGFYDFQDFITTVQERFNYLITFVFSFTCFTIYL